jgi:serine/threonine-protein kinase
MRQLAGALDRAHQEGIVHRDLKPENLFLAEREGLSPIVKILDFGVAKIASETEGQATATGQILGTPRYMAPEQAVDAKQISSAADRFALGLIAFRLLCGRHYFTGDNWVRLLPEVAKAPQARPSAMGSDRGPAFDAWFARACAMEPRNRFATCAEQVAALAEALEGRVAPANWRRVAARSAGVAVACGIAVAAWGIAHRRPSTAAVAPVAVRSATKRASETSTSVAPTPTAASPNLIAPPPEAPASQPAPLAVSRDAPRSGSARPARRHNPAATPPVATAKTSAPPIPPASDRIWDER